VTTADRCIPRRRTSKSIPKTNTETATNTKKRTGLEDKAGLSSAHARRTMHTVSRQKPQCFAPASYSTRLGSTESSNTFGNAWEPTLLITIAMRRVEMLLIIDITSNRADKEQSDDGQQKAETSQLGHVHEESDFTGPAYVTSAGGEK